MPSKLMRLSIQADICAGGEALRGGYHPLKPSKFLILILIAKLI